MRFGDQFFFKINQTDLAKTRGNYDEPFDSLFAAIINNLRNKFGRYNDNCSVNIFFNIKDGMDNICNPEFLLPQD